MAEQELLGKMLFIARETALLLLRERDTVLPFSVSLGDSGEDPETYDPSDARPGATWGELPEAAVEHLASRATSHRVVAGAVVTALESEEERGIEIQVETRDSALFLIYPYGRSDEDWILSDPRPADDVLVQPLLSG